MYGPPGLDVDYCKLFMDSLEPVKDEGDQPLSDQQLFVPSPQTMLNANSDPFRLNQPVPVKEEPEENAFGHYFGLNNDMWSGPSDSSPSDQSVNVDVMDMLGSKQNYKSPQEAVMDPQAVMFYPSPTHGQVVSPPHYQPAPYNSQMVNEPQVVSMTALQQRQQLCHQSTQASPPHQLQSPPKNTGYASPPHTHVRSGYEPHEVPAPELSNCPNTGSVSKRSSSSSSATSVVASANLGVAGRQRKSKSTHNLIEKRYRNNINDKINVLRDCVPHLRELGSSATDGQLDGMPQPRLNKATVLTKAAEYIQQLQRRNEALLKELNNLKSKQGIPVSQMPPLRSPQNEGENFYSAEDYSRPRSASSMSSVSSASQLSPTTKMAATCVVGGALAMGGVLGNEDLRGLAAVPLNLPFAPSLTLGSFLKVASGVSLLGTAISLSQDRSARKNRSAKATQMKNSLQDHRQKAYQTACQMLTISPETSTLGMLWNLLVVMVQIVVLWCMGESMLNAFMELGGIDVRQRRSLLNQAANTQLVGGSVGQQSHLRLLYLFVSQFLQPATPRRYMLQALQSQQLSRQSWIWPLYDWLSHRLWERARKCPPSSARDTSPASDYVPELASLSYTEAMTPRTQRCLGLLYKGRAIPSNRNYTFVTEDHALTSALDLLASFVSVEAQDDALRQFLINEDRTQAHKMLSAAARLAPATSLAELRNITLLCLVDSAGDSANVRDVLQSIQVLCRKYPWAPNECVPAVRMLLLLHHSQGTSKESQAYVMQLAEKVSAESTPMYSPAVILCLFVTLRQLSKNAAMRGMPNLVEAAFLCRQWFGKDDYAGEFGLSVSSRRRLIRESLNMAKQFS